MKRFGILLIFLLYTIDATFGKGTEVKISQSSEGMKLVVDGKDFLVKGMNWDYYPIGTNYTYSLWNESDDFIKSVLKDEMTLLRNMGVNTLRIYAGIPRKWIEYIYENYGIYTMLNHTFGRYGLTVEQEWMANTRYDDPRVEEILLNEVTNLAEEYRETPGLLIYLLGNENNYGLFWEEETSKNVPEETATVLQTRAMYKLFLLNNRRKSVTQQSSSPLSMDQKSAIRARAMYGLFNKAAILMKAVDPAKPVALCNGDMMFIDIIKEECPDVDIFGTNMYRGISFGDTFQRVKQALGKPMMFTEVGADAFDAIRGEEDEESQAYYLLGNWKEIFSNAAGIGGAGNCIGGFTFQFSDGWWKAGQTTNLDVHDRSASWNNGGYYRDEKDGKNNMNEEWFGVCSKSQLTEETYRLQPRAAYFVLKQANEFLPFESTMTLIELEEHFQAIDLAEAVRVSQKSKLELDMKR